MYAGVAEVHATNDYKLILIFDNKERDSMADVQDTTIQEGGDVVIAKDNVPLVRLVPVKSRRKRRIANLHKGAMRMHADFNDPLLEDFARDGL